MRRRGKRPPNNSESTGKVGQELPRIADNQPAPLRPSYPDDPISASADPDDSGAEIDLHNEGVGGEMHSGDESPESDAAAEGAPGNAAGDRVGKRRRRRRRRGARDAENAAPAVIHASGNAGEGPDAGSTDDSANDAGDAGSDDDATQDAPGAGQKMVLETQPAELSTPPAQAPSVAARSPRGFVVLAIGLPGSGKTTWYKRRGVLPLSSDMLRSILFDDITEQRYQGLVFSTLRSLLRARLVAKMPWNYVDATNLSPHERRQWIKMAKSFGYEVQAVFFDVPLEVCLARNQKRERRVSDETIHAMAQRLRPPQFREGFSKITVVRVRPKDSEGAQSTGEKIAPAEHGFDGNSLSEE